MSAKKKADSQSLAKHDPEQLVKENKRLMAEKKTLEDELNKIRAYRWIDASSGKDFRDLIYHSAWDQIYSKSISEIASARDLLEVILSIEGDSVKSYLDKPGIDKAGDNDKHEKVFNPFSKDRIDCLIELFVQCQWRLELAWAQKAELLIKVSDFEDKVKAMLGKQKKGRAKLKNKNSSNTTIEFIDGLKEIVLSEDYRSDFGLEPNNRFWYFPMPDPEDAPTVVIQNVWGAGSPNEKDSGSDAGGDKRRYLDPKWTAAKNRLNVFWRFFWYRYCEEVYHSWLFPKGRGGKKPLVLCLASGIPKSDYPEIEVGDPNTQEYGKQIIGTAVETIFSRLASLGFPKSEIGDWLFAFEQWASVQRSLQNSKARITPADD